MLQYRTVYGVASARCRGYVTTRWCSLSVALMSRKCRATRSWLRSPQNPRSDPDFPRKSTRIQPPATRSCSRLLRPRHAPFWPSCVPPSRPSPFSYGFTAEIRQPQKTPLTAERFAQTCWGVKHTRSDWVPPMLYNFTFSQNRIPRGHAPIASPIGCAVSMLRLSNIHEIMSSPPASSCVRLNSGPFILSHLFENMSTAAKHRGAQIFLSMKSGCWHIFD